MSATTKPFLHTVGRALGQGAAYAVHGTRLGASTLAQGAREGYASKADELRARRDALLREALAQPAPTPAPTPVRQRRITTAEA